MLSPNICLALNAAPCIQTCAVAVNGGVRLQRRNEHKHAYRIKWSMKCAKQQKSTGRQGISAWN